MDVFTVPGMNNFCQLLINILRGEREIPPKSRAGKPLFERDGCMVHNLTAMTS